MNEQMSKQNLIDCFKSLASAVEYAIFKAELTGDEVAVSAADGLLYLLKRYTWEITECRDALRDY